VRRIFRQRRLRAVGVCETFTTADTETHRGTRGAGRPPSHALDCDPEQV